MNGKKYIYNLIAQLCSYLNKMIVCATAYITPKVIIMMEFNQITRYSVHTHEFRNRKWWNLIRACWRVHTHDFKNWARSTHNHPCPQSSLPIHQHFEYNRKSQKSFKFNLYKSPINLKMINISKKIKHSLRQTKNLEKCKKYWKPSNISQIKFIFFWRFSRFWGFGRDDSG